MADIMKALTEATDASGGYTVPDILSREVLALVTAQTVTIPDLQRVQMTSDTLLLPSLTKGTTARWIAETTSITGADVGFGRTTVSAKKVAALMTVSTELLEDSAANVARIITEQFGRDLANAIDAEILGTNTAIFADCLGATSTATNTYSSSAALSWRDLVSASSLVLEDNHSQPDVMYTNPVNIRKLKLLTDSSARPIFDTAIYGSPLLNEGVIGTILGMKVKPTTQLTTSSIIGGVSGQFGYFGTRRNLQVQRDYSIGIDAYVYQANTRVGFAAKYKDAYFIMHAVV